MTPDTPTPDDWSHLTPRQRASKKAAAKAKAARALKKQQMAERAAAYQAKLRETPKPRKPAAPLSEDKLDGLKQHMAKNRIMFFNVPDRPRHPDFPELREPNPLQKQLLAAWLDPKYRTFLYSSGNRGGKTTIGTIMSIAICAGEWPWSGEKIQFSHDLPRKVRIVGQAWESHVKVVVEPALKFWWPEVYELKSSKNNQGITAVCEFYIRGKLQGTIEIMSNVQDSSVFEGWMGDLIYYDEPPKRDVRIACARGLIDRGGRELFCCTLINEAWIMRDVIRATDKDGNPDTSVFHITGDTYSNLGYGINNIEDIEQFSKMLTEEERQARIFGVPFNLSSLVCPRFDRQVHIKERFTIPLNAIIQVALDWHPSKPLQVVFMATLSNGMKYICDEMSIRGNPQFAADEIIRLIRQRGYSRIDRIIIDPLAKSGAPNDNDVYSLFSEYFAAAGYAMETASKEKESGIGILNSWLWTANECARLFFFKDCKQSITEVEDMMFDENFKPVKVKDDAFECVYRLALLNTEWYPEYESKSSSSCVML